MNPPAAANLIAFPTRLVPVVAIALALTALVDFLFYREPVGWTAGFFGLVLLLVLLSTQPPPASRRGVYRVFVAGTAGLCLRCMYEPAALALLLVVAGILTIALHAREGWVRRAEAWLLRHVLLVTLGWFGEIRWTGQRLQHWTRAWKLGRPAFRQWVLIAGLGGLFVFLFALANPLIERVLVEILGHCFAQAHPGDLLLRLAFWLAVFTFLLAVLRYCTGWKEASAAGPAAPPAAWLDRAVIRNALVLFNVLFAIETLLDLYYLWGGQTLPEGFTYAAYAQRGAYPLAVAAMLAGGFVLAAFPAGSRPEGQRVERGLVFLWLGQTLLLVVSAAWRLWLYVDAYNLTRLRFATVAWLLLVFTGLVLIVLRLARQRTGAWLVNANALALLAVLYACAWTGVDAPVAWFNARNSFALRGPGHSDLDAGYLLSLGPDALPALLWYERQLGDSAGSSGLRERIDEAVLEFDEDVRNWRAWTLQRAILAADLAERALNQPGLLLIRLDSGRLLARIPHAILLETYDRQRETFSRDVYRVDAKTKLIDAETLDEFQPDDEISISYRITGGFRQLGTLRRDIPAGMNYCRAEEHEEPDPEVERSAPLAPVPLPAPVAVSPPVPLEVYGATGRVFAIRPGRLVIRELEPSSGLFTNQSYGVVTQAVLRGLSSLSELQADQRVAFRYHLPGGKPMILELAVPGHVLGGAR